MCQDEGMSLAAPVRLSATRYLLLLRLWEFSDFMSHRFDFYYMIVSSSKFRHFIPGTCKVPAYIDRFHQDDVSP